MTAIFAASSIPTLPTPADADKTAHAVVYGVLATVTVRALARGTLARVTTSVMLASIAIAALYGVSDEIHQIFVPGRSPEVLDVVADVTGAVVAAGAIRAWGIIGPLRRS
jgi:VanZ family protein